MPHIIGTAGHIDHGKTALVRALTGQETDRLKEERERGISIDIGFAHMDLSSGERVGIVDVPGHERFIKNMLAGAHGIDLVLLVVAADDGVKPQTEEHLDIVHLLGVKQAVVAITKADLVDAKRVGAVREEIEILLDGTRLAGAPMVALSSISGLGVADLRRVLEDKLCGYQRDCAPGYFRLPVDRAFVVHGHGTVVTGTAIGGRVVPGDTLRVIPGGEELRVRGLQVHGEGFAQATGGQRVALNLAGIERVDVGRGHVVCDARLDRATERLDVWIEIRPNAKRPAKSHQTVRSYFGTAEVIGKLILLEGNNTLPPKSSGFAQLVLRQPIHALRGDHFILRNETAQQTIGGGIVLHPFARRHRRGEPDLIETLMLLRASDEPAAVLETILRIEPEFAVAAGSLAQMAGILPEAVNDALRDRGSTRGLPSDEAPIAYTTNEKWEALRNRAIAALAAFHASAPLAAGMELESLRSRVASDLSSKLFRAIVDALAADDAIVRDDSAVRLPAHRAQLADAEENVASRVVVRLQAAGITPPAVKQLVDELGVAAPRLRGVLQQLERRGAIAKIGEDLYFARPAMEGAREQLRKHLMAHGEINAATFRDLLGASRKFSIGLLDYFDRTGFTMRVGDLRKLKRS